MLPMARTLLTLVYVAAAICELAGIALTVHGFIRDNHDGTAEWVSPTGWRRWRGPGLIGLGVLSGAAGNIAALYPLT